MNLLIVKLATWKIKLCLQFCLNAFYNDVDYLKEATILWLVAHWVQCPVMHINDNAFISNRMLGCDTAFYDDVDNKWQFDRVNDLSATCYIKYSENHYTYIQPLSSHQEKVVFETKDDECIILRANVYSSPKSLGGIQKIQKNIIPLHSLVMNKNHSIVELVVTDKQRKTNIR